MKSERPSIQRQVVATERAAVNLAGHVANLRNLVAAGKRPAHELALFEDYLPDLQAAATTMAYLGINAEHWKAFVARRGDK